MKKNIKTLVALLCVVALCMSVLVGCGNTPSNPNDGTTAGAPDETTAPPAPADTTAAGEPAPFDPAAALEALKEANPAEDNYLVLSGIGTWAPVVMVLDNDGNFFCLVDYAGQATVNFAMGTYEVNEDGSITATGTQYNTGEELIYEITNDNGTYTTSVPVPDTDCVAVVTGTK